MLKKSLFLNLAFYIVLLLSASSVTAEGKADDSLKPVTIDNPGVSVEQLELMLNPLTRDELFAEADGWLKILQEAVTKVSMAQISIKKDAADETKAEDASKEEQAAKDEDSAEKLIVLNSDKQDKIEKLDTVLKEINKKIGLGEKGKELDEVLPYRRYIDSVSGIKLDVTDTKTTWLNIKSWLFSKDGGMQWIINLCIFIAILFVFWILSKILSNAVRKALGFTDVNSQILNDYFVNSVRRVTVFIGLLVEIAAIGVNVAPILAAIVAAGFVVAFALQSTLSNFASGIMIMLYRPFDVGDVVEAAGISGKVQSMTLVSTTLLTPDNKLMVVPNNSIWGNVITNATHSEERRVDMIFGIGYEDDIEKAMQVMREVLDEHPLVLKDPEPTIQLNELGASSVNFICRPWVKTEDYWTVYWEITRIMKQRFDAEGLSIPYPQQDIHIYQHTPALNADSSGSKDKSFKGSKGSDTDEIQEIDIEQDDNTNGA